MANNIESVHVLDLRIMRQEDMSFICLVREDDDFTATIIAETLPELFQLVRDRFEARGLIWLEDLELLARVRQLTNFTKESND